MQAMPIPNPLKRPRCEQCLRPVSYCLCEHITVVPSRTRVLILQHPDEQRHALNTGRLAVLGLKQAELLVGERFAQLGSLLAAEARVFLLFPGEQAQTPQPLAPGPEDAAPLLIVLDGTWRKARKILHENPVLNSLPRLALEAGQPSTYRIRQTGEFAAVSTIEAIVRTLTALEPGQDFSPVLVPFDVLIEQQIQAMGADVYRHNYKTDETKRPESGAIPNSGLLER